MQLSDSAAARVGGKYTGPALGYAMIWADRESGPFVPYTLGFHRISPVGHFSHGACTLLAKSYRWREQAVVAAEREQAEGTISNMPL